MHDMLCTPPDQQRRHVDTLLGLRCRSQEDMGMQYRLEQLEALEAVFSGGLDMVAPWEDEAAGGPAAVGQAEPAPGNAAEWRQRWRGRGNKPRWDVLQYLQASWLLASR